jgi:hypothetical protein
VLGQQWSEQRVGALRAGRQPDTPATGRRLTDRVLQGHGEISVRGFFFFFFFFFPSDVLT